MSPVGKRKSTVEHYEVNRDYTIARMPDGSVWLIETNIAGVIYAAKKIFA